jgi:predicted nucleic acid-binding protein
MSFTNADIELQFVDTNILLYAYDRSAGNKFTVANELLQRLWVNRNGCISIQVLQEFTYNVNRKVKTILSEEVTKQIVQEYAQWRVFSPRVADICAAITVQQRDQLSFWDAMIVYSADVLGCTTLWSEDLNHGQKYLGVEVKNPFLA